LLNARVSEHSLLVVAVSGQFVVELDVPAGYAYQVVTVLVAETASRKLTLATRKPPMRSAAAMERRTRPVDRKPLQAKK
jgi:hypothetical protein